MSQEKSYSLRLPLVLWEKLQVQARLSGMSANSLMVLRLEASLSGLALDTFAREPDLAALIKAEADRIFAELQRMQHGIPPGHLSGKPPARVSPVSQQPAPMVPAPRQLAKPVGTPFKQPGEMEWSMEGL